MGDGYGERRGERCHSDRQDHGRRCGNGAAPSARHGAGGGRPHAGGGCGGRDRRTVPTPGIGTTGRVRRAGVAAAARSGNGTMAARRGRGVRRGAGVGRGGRLAAGWERVRHAGRRDVGSVDAPGNRVAGVGSARDVLRTGREVHRTVEPLGRIRTGALPSRVRPRPCRGPGRAIGTRTPHAGRLPAHVGARDARPKSVRNAVGSAGRRGNDRLDVVGTGDGQRVRRRAQERLPHGR